MVHYSPFWNCVGTMATLIVLGRSTSTNGFVLPTVTRQATHVLSQFSRRWKSMMPLESAPSHNDKDGSILHPDQLGPIPLPASLSPSAVLEFKKCPQSYLLQYLYNLRQPTTLVLAKGSMCHEALEKIFDLEPSDRTLETLHNLLRVSWGKQRQSDKYRFLFETPSKEWDWEAEKEWGQSALELLQNYYQVEDPREVKRPNPLKREMWLRSHLTVDPTLGVTANGSSKASSSAETFYMRGIVDRVDLVTVPGTRGVAMKIVDYKTGKAPDLKYSKTMNDQIVEEAFYQLKVYALLIREKGAGFGDEGTTLNNLRFLELLYLTSASGKAQPLRYDLGETQEQRDIVLQGIHQDLSAVWQDICDLVALQDPKAFVGCDRSFCYFHKCRDRFVPGTLWEPDQSMKVSF